MPIDQLHMLREALAAALDSAGEPLSAMLKRLAATACQVFRFSRATVSLLDEGGRAYLMRAAAGRLDGAGAEMRNPEVPREVIDRLFAGRYRVKMVYHGMPEQGPAGFIDPRVAERRTQQRRERGGWHEWDLVAVRLADEQDNTVGFMTLSDPAEDGEASRELFQSLELFGMCASAALRFHGLLREREKQVKRYQQLLVSGGVFRLELTLQELFSELVWAVRFSSGFRLVMLGLVDKKSGTVKMKAVACADKLKSRQLREVRLPLSAIIPLMGRDWERRRSHLVIERREVFREYKRVYYGSALAGEPNPGTPPSHQAWPAWGVLLLPVRSRSGGLYGLLAVDDPAEGSIPRPEEVQLLEILAGWIAAAIDNRNLYVQARKRVQELVEQLEALKPKPDFNENPTEAIKAMAESIFKDFKWRREQG
ncbi:MAG: hypothetical protein ACOC8N_02840, partial [Spirochaetota bacterium]